MSITMLPVASQIGNSIPIAAAKGSSMMCTSRAPASAHAAGSGGAAWYAQVSAWVAGK
jgi:hypothetical protein